MTTPKGNRPVPPSQWPKKWVREESFWREMVTRTLSGMLVLGVGASGAVLAGYGTHEQRMTILKGVLILAVLALIGIALIFGIAKYAPIRTGVFILPKVIILYRGRGLLITRYKLHTRGNAELWNRWGAEIRKHFERRIDAADSTSRFTFDIEALEASMQEPESV